MIRPAIACTYWFESSSQVVLYETLLYTDRTTSCSCPGWCRRVDKEGNRSCKHTRMVEAGMGMQESVRHLIHINSMNEWIDQPRPTTTKTTAPAIMPTPGQRKMIIE